MDDKKFEDIQKQLSEIQTGITQIRVVYEDHQRRLDRTERALYGNGNTGLCTKVSAILYLTSAITGFVCLLLAQAISAWMRS